MDCVALGRKSFSGGGMAKLNIACSSADSAVLAEVQIQLLATGQDKARARRFLGQHHYLGDVRAVGEQLF
jgi:hypothetical protein